MGHGFSLMMMQIEKCITFQGDKTKTVGVDWCNSIITAPCVTALAAVCDCVGRSFLHTQGHTYDVPTTWGCKYMVLSIQFDFWKKNTVYCVYAVCLHSSF